MYHLCIMFILIIALIHLVIHIPIAISPNLSYVPSFVDLMYTISHLSSINLQVVMSGFTQTKLFSKKREFTSVPINISNLIGKVGMHMSTMYHTQLR